MYVLEPIQQGSVVEALGTVFGRRRINLDSIRIVQGEFSFLRLKEWSDRITRGNLLAIPGVTLTDIDEARNRLRIGVARRAVIERVEAELRRFEVPRKAVIIEETGPIRLVSGHTLQDERRPLMGGLQIAFRGPSGQFICTLGFLALHKKGKGFVTSSHCGEAWGRLSGTEYGQPSTAKIIGKEAFNPDYVTKGDQSPDDFRRRIANVCPPNRTCRASDAMFVVADIMGLGLIARTESNSTTVTGTYRVIDIEEYGFPGETLVKIGAKTGKSEGKIDGTCMAVDFDPLPGIANGDKITLICQDMFIGQATHGDSGAPVFREVGNSGEVILYGILAGGYQDKVFFSPIRQIVKELGPLIVR